ncbi:MAG: hypothetical protein U5L03_10440 [Burkholderiaceae bacterium]|nr:hypothetical protein [Burkholderiaceae bacterium]
MRAARLRSPSQARKQTHLQRPCLGAPAEERPQRSLKPMECNMPTDLRVDRAPATTGAPRSRSALLLLLAAAGIASNLGSGQLSTEGPPSPPPGTAVGPPVAVTVTVIGNGALTSEPPGINCPTTCSAPFATGVFVTLVPLPAAGQRFFSWGGSPDCSDGLLTAGPDLSCSATFVPAIAPPAAGSGWTLQGSPLSLVSEVDPAPSVARAGANPVAAYVEAVAGDVARLFVKRLNGTTWETLGGASLNAASITAASEPSIATTPAGQPYVAWIQGDGIQQNLFVARFNGSAWESVGEPGIPLNTVAGSTARSPSLAINESWHPVVAWIENGRVRLKRFDGIWRTPNGGTGPDSANADHVRLALDSLGSDPVLAFRQSLGTAFEFRATYSGDYRPLAPPIATGAGADPMFAPLAGINPSQGGTASVAVALSERPTPITLRVLRGTGGSYSDFGAGPLLANDPRRLTALAGAAGFERYAVAYSATDAANDTAVTQVLTYSEATQTWVPTGTPLTTTDVLRVRGLSLALVAADSPLLATSQRATATRWEARVWRWFP